MKRPRFSLRGLLILTALVAALCYWRDRPRQNANRFIALIEAGDYRAAEAMFNERVGISHPPSIFQHWKVTSDGQSPAEWLRCRYPLTVRAMIGRRPSNQMPVEALTVRAIVGRQSYLLSVEATATGLTRNDMWKPTSATSIWRLWRP